MTAGHKHVLVKVKPGGYLYWFLRKPRFHTSDRQRAYRSRWVYGVCPRTDQRLPTCWSLSILGVLHTLTGLTLFWDNEDYEDHEDY